MPLPRDLGPNDAVYYDVTPNYIDDTSTIPTAITMVGTIQRADGSAQQLFFNTLPNVDPKTGLDLEQLIPAD